MLKAMVESVGLDPSLMEVRLLAMCLISFAGFLRCDELIKLKCSDITINAVSMIITVAPVRQISTERDLPLLWLGHGQRPVQ